jgi:hypothetical protein
VDIPTGPSAKPLDPTLAVTGFLPFGRSWISSIARSWRALRDRFLGNPSFAAASAVFVAVFILQLVNFGLHFRDPEMAGTGFSIFGVPYSDARGWHDQGASIGCGQGMTRSWPALRPGYGIFLALLFTWTGPSYVLAVILNLVLMALTSALLCQIGEKLASRWAGVLVALGFATQHLTLTYPLTLGTESLGLFCSVFSLHQMLHAIEAGNRRHFLLAGVFLGLSNLARPLTLPVFPLYLVCITLLFQRSWAWRGVLTRLAVFAAGLFVAIGPWLLRQWIVYGILTISSNTADALYPATAPQYGSWSGDIYREPGCPSGIKERYDYFMNKAKANLKENPRFYLHNVRTSYLSCFRALSASARPHLTVLGVLALLGYFVSWNARKRTPWQTGLSTLALGLIVVTFLFACKRREASLDLFMLLLLPLVTCRPAAALLHVLGLLGSIMGVAMFGMTGGDPRLLFVLEWGFLLSPVVFLWGLSARMTRFLETATAHEPPLLSAGMTSSGMVSPILPRWFVVVRAGVMGFLVVGGVRLAVLNAMNTKPPTAPRLLTPDEAIRSLREFDHHAPGLLRRADLQQDQILTRFREQDKSASHNKILVLPIRLFDYPYYLPKNVHLSHWSPYFTARDYDRTVSYFSWGGGFDRKTRGYCYPVLFPGFLPGNLYDQDALLICRVHFDPGTPFEQILFEGIALIPMDESRNLRLDDAYFTTHPHHPGTNPQFATQASADGRIPGLSLSSERN